MNCIITEQRLKRLYLNSQYKTIKHIKDMKVPIGMIGA